MKKKSAIRYLRISTERQSNFSISAQDTQTAHWCERNDVQVIDTFTDEGYSARNFDRPDMTRLNAFIEKNFATTDYLVVNAFDRFSRDAGEAIVAIKNLQKKFGIKVVSVSEGVTFDADDPGSFFYAGLMLLKGEDEIIRNRGRINMGIYQAKKVQGRYLGASPFGYKNARDEKNIPIIVIDEDRRHIIQYIFDAFLSDVPMKEILVHATSLGFTTKGNGAITKVLSCPVHTGLINIRAYKDHPAELSEGIHDAIISRTDWLAVQQKLKGRTRHPITIINNEFPLRGVLRCHCNLPLTGALSTNKIGKKFGYYNCKKPGHNTISTIKAHAQLQEVFNYLSLSRPMITAIRSTSEQAMEAALKVRTRDIRIYKADLLKAETKLKSVEDKWILNQLSFDTYQRWHTELGTQRMALKAQIEKLSRDQGEVWMLLQQDLNHLADMRSLYDSMNTIEKQQVVRLVFDSQLYYREGIYRTPYMMPTFSANIATLKERRLLEMDIKKGIATQFPSGGLQQFPLEHLTQLLTLIHNSKVA